MGLFSHKAAPVEKPAVSRGQPHVYVAPARTVNGLHVSCQVCGQPPDDFLHTIVVAEAEPEAQTHLHWS
jgi:hypothetical protein